MTRDFDFIREILFQVEKAPSGEPIQFLSFEREIDDALLGEHLEIMIEAGLIDGEVLSLRPVSFIIKRLTWSGHDFVNNARNDTVWKQVMADAKAKGVSVTMSVLNGLLTKMAQKYTGLGCIVFLTSALQRNAVPPGSWAVLEYFNAIIAVAGCFQRRSQSLDVKPFCCV